jgi:hypothetical protein
LTASLITRARRRRRQISARDAAEGQRIEVSARAVDAKVRRGGDAAWLKC